MLSVNIFYRKIIEVLTMNNNELLKNLAISCNHSDETQRIYRLALTNYASYFNQALHELLAEAEEDENNLKWKHRRVKAKLTEYRHHLLQKYALNTVKKHMIAIKKFYRFYDIEIQKLPIINEKSMQKPQPIYFKDLPDKEIIREAVSIASPFMKAVILFICSIGCGRAETLNLTIHDLLFRGSIEKIYAIETLVSTKEFININPPDIILTRNWIFQTMFLHRSFH